LKCPASPIIKHLRRGGCGRLTLSIAHPSFARSLCRAE
jgi:hypothetical protein